MIKVIGYLGDLYFDSEELVREYANIVYEPWEHDPESSIAKRFPGYEWCVYEGWNPVECMQKLAKKVNDTIKVEFWNLVDHAPEGILIVHPWWR